ncbi:hypothetical protein [Maritimibacter sp. 55A14]|uniref:hypothetical protein n=1 Tax=Maritimibacter sp. 55A14 TaxID=2174844 RepID=UPI00130494EF|nr:hypothetical protein [Maritimibacter sp. 55A14]
MTLRAQKRLAIAAALLVVAVFVSANTHLLSVALGSQPACTAAFGAAPAKRAC